MQINNSGHAYLYNTTVIDNTAEAYAGAIHILNPDSYLEVENSRFERNKAKSDVFLKTRGGVILVENEGKVNITNTLF